MLSFEELCKTIVLLDTCYFMTIPDYCRYDEDVLQFHLEDYDKYRMCFDQVVKTLNEISEIEKAYFAQYRDVLSYTRCLRYAKDFQAFNNDA